MTAEPFAQLRDKGLGVVRQTACFQVRRDGLRIGLKGKETIRIGIVVSRPGHVDLAGLKGLGVPDDVVADEDILADVSSAPDAAVVADPGGALDGGARLNNGAGAEADAVADERPGGGFPGRGGPGTAGSPAVLRNTWKESWMTIDNRLSLALPAPHLEAGSP